MAVDDLDYHRTIARRRDPWLAKLGQHRRRRYPMAWLLFAAALLTAAFLVARGLYASGFGGPGYFPALDRLWQRALDYLSSLPMGLWIASAAIFVAVAALCLFGRMRGSMLRRRNRRRLLHYEQEQARRWDAHRRH